MTDFQLKCSGYIAILGILQFCFTYICKSYIYNIYVKTGFSIK